MIVYSGTKEIIRQIAKDKNIPVVKFRMDINEYRLI